jgi:hypothetical protein
VVIAGLIACTGMRGIWQQEPSLAGVAQTWCVGICPICIIIIGQWQPQLVVAMATLELQFTTATSGDPKSASSNNVATGLKRQLTNSPVIVFRRVTPAGDVGHMGR